MTRARSTRPALVGLLVVVLAAVAALVAAATRGGDGAPTARIIRGEEPTALARHLETLAATRPDYMENEGPASAAEEAFMQRAYPEDTISVAQMNAARAAFDESKSRQFHGGQGKKGEWVSVGPSKALYPFEQLRTSGLYVPNAYVAGGRTTSIALAPKCTPNKCPAYITPAGGGVWRTNNVLPGPAALDVPGRAARHQRGRRRDHRPERPDGRHGLRRHRRGEHLRLRLRCRHRRLQVDRRWQALERPDRPDRVPGQGRRPDRGHARPAEHDLRRDDDRPSRHELDLLHGRDAAGPGDHPLGPLQVDERRRVVELHPQRLRERVELHGHDRRVQQHGHLLAARRAAAPARPVEPRASSTPPRTHAASGAPTTPARRGRRSSRP